MAFNYKQTTHHKGFTLIELIIVILVSGIIATLTTRIITLPINAYIDSSRRSILSSTSESALVMMQRDIRHALPNSIRISRTTEDEAILELLPLIDGGRYRANSTGFPDSGDILDFTTTDTSFDVLGSLQNFSKMDLTNNSVVIYPLGSARANPYRGDNIVPIDISSTAKKIVFQSFKFHFSSPQQRFFIVSTPISYHCDTSPSERKNKVLRRYEGYRLQARQPTPPIAASSIQANFIASCDFSFKRGSSTRAGLVTLNIKLTDEAGESIRLINQIHIVNEP